MFFFIGYFIGNLNAQAFKRNEVSVGLGYGFINLSKVFLKKFIEIPEYKVSKSQVFTLIGEYNLLKRFSFGISGTYNRIKGESKRFEIADQITLVYGLIRGNYHYVLNKWIDPYIGGGVGLSSYKYKNLNSQTVGINPNEKVPGTFDFSLQAGIKYFPTKHLGVYTEIGYVGAAVFHVGVSGKF